MVMVGVGMRRVGSEGRVSVFGLFWGTGYSSFFLHCIVSLIISSLLFCLSTRRENTNSFCVLGLSNSCVVYKCA